MSTVVSNDPRIQEVRVSRDQITAHLVDGRVISVPLAWSWRLTQGYVSATGKLPDYRIWPGHPLAGCGRGY